eukprot:6191661-Pleurochrysis_carterae.AAC.6
MELPGSESHTRDLISDAHLGMNLPHLGASCVVTYPGRWAVMVLSWRLRCGVRARRSACSRSSRAAA